MINRIYFISDWTTAEEPEENVHYIITVDPRSAQSIDNTYRTISDTRLPSLGLAIRISGPISAAALQFAAAACFLPSSLRIHDQPVLLLLGNSPQLLEQASAALDTYLGQQGLAARIHRVPSSTLHTSPQAMASHYSSLLTGDHCYGNELFFFSSSPEEQLAALSALRQTENRFRQDFPAQAALIAANQHLEKDLRSLQRKLTSTETELTNQRQFVEVLRSTHAAKELQDYYTNEYEILPLWFKRLGHLVKVLTGKRTFRSLFRDDVKKYKV